MSKVITSWSRVRPGDIISFRYKGGKSTAKLVTILVLNPKIRLHQNKQFYLVGLKLEEQGVIPHIRNKSEVVELLERIGVIEVVDFANEIYRVDIKGVGPKGFRERNYRQLKQYINQHDSYRTYLWEDATNSQVFLEPIKLPKSLKEALVEN